MTTPEMFPEAPPEDELIFVGYDHAGIIGGLRPDVAYPSRKIKRAKACVSTITAELCDCPDEKGHVEVFVRLVK